MAIPSIPLGLDISQGDGNVNITWNMVGGATSYSVQRSTDGINFSSVGTPTTPFFLDTTVAINTMYYYQVASVNGSGTSPYSAGPNSALQAVPTSSGTLSLYELRLRSQQRADKFKSNYVINSEWNYNINKAYEELYNILTTTYEDYNLAPRLSFQTTGTGPWPLPDGQLYNKAPALFKLYGVDNGLNASEEAWVTMKKFNMSDRNRYVFPQLQSNFLGMTRLRYRMLGNFLHFRPIPPAGQQFSLWYVPRLKQLVQDTDFCDGINGFHNYIIVRAAKYALNKQMDETPDLDAELMMIKKNIEEEAQNRDQGTPDTISNTRRSNWGDDWGGDDGDGWGGGGSWGF